MSLAVAGLMLLAVVRFKRRMIRIVCAGVLTLTLISGGFLFWYAHRPLPSPVDEQVFRGVEYIRDVRSTPRPLVIHVVRIDLDTPGIRLFVTPGGEDNPARTVSQFLDEFDLQLAVNGDFFDPWHDSAPWDYYPHVGDPVNTRGLAASEGTVFTRGYAPRYDTIYFTSDNRVSFDVPGDEIYNAISGNLFLILDGGAQIPQDIPGGDTHPRTALGVDASERTLILMVVDGRQPNYSEGVTLRELTDLLLEYGAYHAINLDGGGSSTMVIESADGRPQVLNSPIHTRIPGRERPIANQLGVYAPR